MTRTVGDTRSRTGVIDHEARPRRVPQREAWPPTRALWFGLAAAARAYHDIKALSPGTSLHALDNPPPKTMVFTHAPDIVYLDTGHFAISLPTRRQSIWTYKRPMHYRQDVIDVGRARCRHRGVGYLVGTSFVYFEAQGLAKAAGLHVDELKRHDAILRVDAGTGGRSSA